MTVVIEGKRWATMNGPRTNPYAHQALMNTWKGLAVLAARAAGVKHLEAPVTITATVRRTTNSRADAHNVAPTIKACIDGAVAAEVIPDDNDGIVRALVIQRGPKATAPTIELTIEES